jgi:hypothetical protein
MKNIVVLLLAILMTPSCAHKIAVNAPSVIRTARYAYLKDDKGRVYIFTASAKDFDEAMKALHPGPASVNKLDVWVVTPAKAVAKKVN